MVMGTGLNGSGIRIKDPVAVKVENKATLSISHALSLMPISYLYVKPPSAVSIGAFLSLKSIYELRQIYFVKCIKACEAWVSELWSGRR